jgi:FixJ family two-component response regulator
MTTTEQTVFIVDDDPIARQSVETLVEPMGVRTETFCSGEDFLDRYEEDVAGCLITDVRLRGISGIDLQDRLNAIGSGLPVIVVTAFGDVPSAIRAMRGGAVTYLNKPCRNDELWDMIREALENDVRIRRRRDRRTEIARRLAKLTDRHRAVMNLLLQGNSHKVIARHLDISIRTVEARRSRILKVMQTNTLVELGCMLAEFNADENALLAATATA